MILLTGNIIILCYRLTFSQPSYSLATIYYTQEAPSGIERLSIDQLLNYLDIVLLTANTYCYYLLSLNFMADHNNNSLPNNH